MVIKFWVYDVPNLLKIEPKQVWWNIFVKNSNGKSNNSKVYIWKVPELVYQLGDLFEHLFL